MKKKLLVYLFKLIYFAISWFVITFNCTGEINTNLFCISIFTYSGGIVFDSLFYSFESENTVSLLRTPTIVISNIVFVINLLITFLILCLSSIIMIPFDESTCMYNITLNSEIANGFINMYPSIASYSISLKNFMTFVFIVGAGSLIPAFLLEMDMYIRVKNEKYVNRNNKNKKDMGKR